MSAAEPRPGSYGRRIRWLGIAVAMVVGVYTAGWFYVADLIQTRARDAIAQMNGSGVTADCANPTARGFPFRIGLFCDRVAFADPAQGIGISAGSFRSAGQIYDPMRLIAELDGPAKIDIPDGGAIDIGWEALRASVRLAQPLPQRVSVEGRAVVAKLPSGAPIGAVQRFEAHMRPNDADVDLAATVDSLALDPALLDGGILPALSLQSDLTVTDGARLVQSRAETLRGTAGTIRTLVLSSDKDTSIAASGPFSIDTDGLIDATLKVTVRNPQQLSAIVSQLFPQAKDQIAASAAGLSALGTEPTLPLSIVKGKATLGFIPLGDIPPL